MTKSPPAGYPRVIPYLNYEDVDAAIPWLTRAFGLVERHRIRGAAGVTTHAEMTLEDGVVMMGRPVGEFRSPRRLGQTTSSLYVYVEDVDSHYDTALSAGAEILEEPANQAYGDRRYGAADPEGHRWYFAAPVAGER